MHRYTKAIQQITALRCPKSIKEKRNAEGRTVERIPQPWTVIDARENDHSFDVALHVPLGYSAADLQQETDAIYAAVGCPVTIRDKAGVAIVSIHKHDFPDVIPFSPSMLDLTKGRSVLCGFDCLGNPVTHNFRVPHVLIGAQSGYGKTDLLRFWLLQLIHQFTPDQLHIDIIDGKGFSFLPFRGVPHIRRIVRDLPSAAAVLADAKRIMLDRSNRVWDEASRELSSGFRFHLVFVDELATISPGFQVTKDAKQLATIAYADMAAVACVGREAGLGMIMATQRPDANVIHPQVKQNCDVSIALRCKTQTNSEIILDRPGAEKLPQGKPGRAIYAGTVDTIFQIPYIGKDDVWAELLKPYKKEWREQPDERPAKTVDLNDLC